MANDFFNATGAPSTRSAGSSSPVRAEFAAIQAGFAKLPTLTGNGNKLVQVNTAGTGMVASLAVASTNTASAVVQRDASGNFSAGTITAALSGNASTSTKLATARNINGVAFDGTAAITVTASTPNALTAGSHLTGGAFNGSAAVTLAVDATSANTASKVVARDASGNFSAGTITAALSGNAATTTKLATARNINGVAFDGSANITVADSTKLPLTGGTLTGKLATVASAAASAGFALPHGAAPTTPANGDIWTTTAAILARINGVTKTVAFTDSSITGNAASATVLATARNINGVSFNGSADITVADSTKLPLAGGTMTGKLTTDAPAAAAAGLNLPHGTAPTTPANGDVWSTTAGLLARINGATKTVAFTDSSITGNAATATVLATARTINGVSFNGSANITVADSTKLPLDGGTMTGLLQVAAGASHCIRMTNDGAYLSGYDTAGTTRTGLLQFDAGTYVRLMADTAIPLVFYTTAIERFRLEATGKGKFSAGAYTATMPVTFSATPTFDCDDSNIFELGALTSNVTSMTIANASSGQSISIRFVQDATGGRTVALPSGAKVDGSIATGANRVSYLNLVRSAAGARWEGNWFQVPA